MNNFITAESSGMNLEADNIEMLADNIAGRDLIIENNYHQNRRKFNEVNLFFYDAENYISPSFTQEAINLVLQNRVMLLTGGYGFDKESFANHLGARIKNVLPDLCIVEWQFSGEEIPNFAKEILESELQSLFIIHQIGPKEVEFSLEKLKKNAEQKGCYVIITSNQSLDVWQLPELTQKKNCFQIPENGLYAKDVLVDVLIKQFEKHKNDLLFETVFDVFELSIALTSRHTVSSLANVIETPEQAYLLVEILSSETNKISAKRLDEIIISFNQDNESLISGWFRNLGEQEKLIALGAILFEGLHEDQFFGVMDEVTKEFWHHRNPNLKSLDYGDINFVLNFFKFESYDMSTYFFKAKFPSLKVSIIKTAWHTHRRHILMALPILVNLSRNSILRENKNRGIYNSRGRRMLLRSVIAHLLSDLGMVSLGLVEDRLLDFAASNDERLQRVTAIALARWKEFGQEILLFDTLRRWRLDDRINEKMGDLLDIDDEPEERNYKASIYIKKTILLTLGYTAKYDAPNNLHPAIIELICDLADERTGMIQTKINDLLPDLITNHFSQLRNIIPSRLLIHHELQPAIIESILELYESAPLETAEVIDEWLNDVLYDHSEENRRYKPTYRDEILITILRIYQSLSYGEDEPITQEKVWTTLQILFKEEGRYEIRRTVLETIGVFIALDHEYALPQIKQLFENADFSEKEIILSGLAKVYIRQRQELPSTSYTISVNGIQVPSYDSSFRPLTSIETTLYKWLDTEDEFKRQIALLTFIQFSKEFDRPESLATPVYIAPKSSSFQQKAQSNNLQQRQQRAQSIQEFNIELHWTSRLWIWWWLLFEDSDTRQVLREVMRTLILYKPMIRFSDIAIVMRNFNNQSGERPNKIAHWMKRLYQRIID